MKVAKLLIFIFVLLFSSVIIDYQSIFALPPVTCLVCLQNEDGSYYCDEQSPGYITCDKNYRPCKMTTDCK